MPTGATEFHHWAVVIHVTTAGPGSVLSLSSLTRKIRGWLQGILGSPLSRWVKGMGGRRKTREPGLTFSREYWQEAMTRQNWKTQMSVKKPLSSNK